MLGSIVSDADHDDVDDAIDSGSAPQEETPSNPPQGETPDESSSLDEVDDTDEELPDSQGDEDSPNRPQEPAESDASDVSECFGIGEFLRTLVQWIATWFGIDFSWAASSR